MQKCTIKRAEKHCECFMRKQTELLIALKAYYYIHYYFGEKYSENSFFYQNQLGDVL